MTNTSVNAWHVCILLLVYLFFHLPEVLIVTSYKALHYPLESIYISSVMFDGLNFSRQFANSIAIPSNVGLFYGPINFILSFILNKVQQIYWFNFIVQAAVPVLSYQLMMLVTSRLNAFLIAVFLTICCVRTNWWSPDFLIQPLLLAILYLWFKRNRRDILHYILLGLLVAVVAAFKYHEGLILMVTLGAGLMFQLSKINQIRKIWAIIDATVVILCFVAFALTFVRKFLFVDELLYFTFPLAMLICSFFILFSKLDIQILSNYETVRSLLIFAAVSLSIPLITFAILSHTFGIQKYFYAVFQMGLNFLPTWDFGIGGLIWRWLPPVWWVGSIMRLAFTCSLVALPFVVNIYIAFKLISIANCSTTSFSVKQKAMAVGCIAIVGTYMMYPFEGYHILISKIGLFIFTLLYFIGNLHLVKRLIPICMITLILPSMGRQIIEWQKLHKMAHNQTPISEINNVVGITLAKPLLRELTRQVETIKMSVPKGHSYYVVDSSGGSLIGLASLVPNGIRQMYIEMRPGLVDSATAKIIIDQLSLVNYVLVLKKDMDDYISGILSNKGLMAVLGYLDTNFKEIASYVRYGEEKEGLDLEDFIILKRNS